MQFPSHAMEEEKFEPDENTHTDELALKYVPEEKKNELIKWAKKYYNLEKKFKAEPFFSRLEYYLISANWLRQWKNYVGYSQVNSALPLTKHFGCGKLSTANEDIIENKQFGSFRFQQPDFHLNIRLKPELQQGKDYQFITKQMYYALLDCSDYEMIRVPRMVVKTKEGKKVQLYYFKINLLIMFNDFCREIEHEDAGKFVQLSFQYSHYANIREMEENIFKYIKAQANKKKYVDLEHGLPVRLWLLSPDTQKNILFNSFKQGCRANPTFQYKLYLGGEILSSNNELSDYEINDSSFIMAQLKQQKLSWLFFNQKYLLEGVCNLCREKKTLKHFCSCKYAIYCSTTCKTKDKFTHKTRCPNQAESDQEQQEMHLTQYSNKGKTGLRNLGNTCFMNSGLQCVSHIKELLQFFVTNKYIADINKENPLGTRGQLSTAFAKMVQNLWFGKDSSFSPAHLKKAIGKYQPMFSGYNQHDSSELINYLLDGLHEDLNRIKQKPYVQTKDYDGRPDIIVAKQAWQNFLKRNQSIIVDLMYGQYKSVLDCPKCKYQSVQFDPFLMVSLPIVNSKKKRVELVFIKNHVEEIKITLSYDSGEKRTMQWAYEQIKSKLVLPADANLIAYIASSSMSESIKNSTQLDEIRKQNSYRTVYVRELLKGEDPSKDVKVLVTNMLCHSIYGNENYRRSIIAGRLYFFSKQLTYKQVHHRIYSYYKQFYEVASYEQDVIQQEPDAQPFRLLCMPSTHYMPCDYCNKKNCEGCWLAYSDDKFLPVKNIDNIVEIQFYWRKNKKQVEQKMQALQSGPKTSSSKNTSVSIEDCFELFQQPELLSQENVWYCPKCKDFVQARKQMQLYKVPKILILCLKRFKRKEFHTEKYNVLVNYPVEGLDLSKFVQNTDLPHVLSTESKENTKGALLYDLIAVSNHMGSCGGGHYTAYCKDITTQNWNQFDDSYVSQAKKTNVVSEAGYVLFYKRRQ